MSILVGNPFLLDAGAGVTGYQISRSLRFNSPDSAFLSRTFTSAGNRKTWTWAAWVKRSALGSVQRIFAGYDGGMSDDNYTALLFFSDDTIRVGGYSVFFRTSNAVFRDTSAWMHIVFIADLNNANNALKFRVWVNNVELTWTDTGSNPTTTGINAAVLHGLGAEAVPAGSSFCNLYLADVYFIDGQALTPSSFTEANATTGQLIPKTYTGTFGTNGFWLKFSDNSATTSTTLGKDYSGNSNNWTPNNFNVLNGNGNYVSGVSGAQTTGEVAANLFDGNTGTFCSAATNGGTVTVTFTPSRSVTSSTRIFNGSSTLNVAVNGGSAVNYTGTGWKDLGFTGTLSSISYTHGGGAIGSMTAIELDGIILLDNSVVGRNNDSLVDTPTSYGTDTGAGGTVRGNYATLNLLKNPGGSTTFVNGNLETTFAFNGVNFPVPMGTFGVSSGKWYWEVTPTSGASGSGGVGIGIGNAQCAPTNAGAFGVTANGWGYYYSGNKYNNNTSSSYGASYTNYDVIGVALDCDNGTLVFYKNGASQGTAYTGLTSGPYFPAMGNAGDTTTCVFNAGQRPFAYTAPSNFKALCDTNLTAPTIAKGNTAMDVKLYTGTGSTQSITGLGFSPDLLWFKNRSSGNSHVLFDNVRGRGAALSSESSQAETSSNPGNDLASFDSNGFTVGPVQNWNSPNINGGSIVAWAWDAGSSTVTNNSGSITGAQVRTNVSAGFSIVTYTGTGSAATVGHGLGVAPAMFIVKNRSVSSDWDVYHSGLPSPATNRIVLQSTAAAVGAGGTSAWNSTDPTSTVISLGAGTSINSNGSNHVLYAFAPVAGYSSFGSYTGNGSSDGPFVFCNFRPKWVLLKRSSGTSNWLLYDSMRDTYNVTRQILYPNLSDAETTGVNSVVDFLSNGFKIRDSGAGELNTSASTYIYAAFAENPFKYARAR